ncbi:MAG: hypothetical protein QXP31_06340 [Pyrobaculum sp.]
MDEVGVGIIELGDGSVLQLKILIIDVKEVGFSPFGGVDLDVKVVGGISLKKLPEEIQRHIAQKPLAIGTPVDGWEIVDIVRQTPAEATAVVETSKGKFKVVVVAEAVMAARNLNYKTRVNEPNYLMGV